MGEKSVRRDRQGLDLAQAAISQVRDAIDQFKKILSKERLTPCDIQFSQLWKKRGGKQIDPFLYSKFFDFLRPPDIAHDALGNAPLGDLNTDGLRFGRISSRSEILVPNPIGE